jgi:nucleolin
LTFNVNIQKLNGRLLTVNKAAASTIAQAEEGRSPHRSRSSSVKIYVGNLPWDVDGSKLTRLFSEYGVVVGAEVLYDYGRGGWRSRGFGFVTMERREEAEDAIWDLDGQVSDFPAIYVCTMMN